MATAVILPKQGNSVESCIIVSWKKQPGDSIDAGEAICEVETDKAVMEVESPEAGTVLELFFEEGDDVPVLENIAAVGNQGEDASGLRPSNSSSGTSAVNEPAPSAPQPSADKPEPPKAQPSESETPDIVAVEAQNGSQAPVGISPRARNLAVSKGLNVSGLSGTGPGGRVIERDVQKAIASGQPLTPAAREHALSSGATVPGEGTGLGGRVTVSDLKSGEQAAPAGVPSAEDVSEFETVPVKGIRKLISDRMLQSLQTTAQLTLNSEADARSLQAFRKRVKAAGETVGVGKVSVNDMILYTVSRTLKDHPGLNCLYQQDKMLQYNRVHLGFAVDTPRGLMVPVIRNAQAQSLLAIGQEARRMAAACLENKIQPDEMNGGTFTVTNLGALGVHHFTPVLNPPQVGILGVGGIKLQPEEIDGKVEFIPKLALSLTINHQVVDGAPAARFLQDLCNRLANFDLLLAA